MNLLSNPASAALAATGLAMFSVGARQRRDVALKLAGLTALGLALVPTPALADQFIEASDGSTIDCELARGELTRIGLDHVIGGYNGVVPAAASGVTMNSIPMVDTNTVKSRLDKAEGDWTLLDVRDADEREASAIDGSEHIYVGELNERWSQLDKDRSYTLICASGMRATVAAGWLASRGFSNLDIYLGSMGAWKAAHG